MGQLLRAISASRSSPICPVTSAPLDRAEPTFFLTLFSLLIACAIALPIGIYAAYRRGLDFSTRLRRRWLMLAASIPSFWLGLIMMQVFAVRFDLFPVSGYGGPGSTFTERMYHLALPAFALGTVSTASALALRFTRASMLDVLGDDYIRTARAKGLIERRVILKHALKNAADPDPDRYRPDGGGSRIGCGRDRGPCLVCRVAGNLVVSAVLRRDYPVIQGALLVIAALLRPDQFCHRHALSAGRSEGTLLMTAIVSKPALSERSSSSGGC